MSIETNKDIVRRYYHEAVEQAKFEVLQEHISPNWVNHTPGMPHVTGPEGARQINEFFQNALPNPQVTIDDLVGEGDTVAIRFTYSGLHEGELLGVAPTGKLVSFTGSAFHRIIDDKITDDWIHFDIAGVLQQIGASPIPAASN